jgi:hypothetical protein
MQYFPRVYCLLSKEKNVKTFFYVLGQFITHIEINFLMILVTMSSTLERVKFGCLNRNNGRMKCCRPLVESEIKNHQKAVDVKNLKLKFNL